MSLTELGSLHTGVVRVVFPHLDDLGKIKWVKTCKSPGGAFLCSISVRDDAMNFGKQNYGLLRSFVVMYSDRIVGLSNLHDCYIEM